MRPFLCNCVKRFLLVSLFSLFLSYHSIGQQSLTTIDGWNAYVHLPDDYNSTQQNYPVIVFIAGIGEVGTDPSKMLVFGPSRFVSQGHNMQFTVNGNVEKPIVISIQPVSAWPSVTLVARKVDSIRLRWRVDPDRFYLTGLSMGGWAWDSYVTANQTYANKIAAIVAMSAPPPDVIANFQWYATGGGKWWGFEGTSDYRSMDKIRDTMNAYVPGSARYTQYVGGHCCWNTWYDPSWNENGETIYTWMLKQSRSGAVNQLPTANAGTNQSVTLPANSVTISGSGNDPDGNIASYLWTKVSGPAQFSIATSSQPQTVVSNLVEGVYQFELKVTDNQGAVGRDTMAVTVNIVSSGGGTANAGADSIIFLNQTRPDTAILNGSNSQGATSFLWTKISGPGTQVIANPAAAVTNVLNMEEGVYQFQLTVNGTEKDTVKITVRDFMKKNIRPCRTGQPQAFTLAKTSATELYRPYLTRDNIIPGLMGGDTLYIPGGVYTSGIEIGDIGGGPGCPIVIAPKDEPVIIKNDGYFRVASRDTAVICYAKFDGTLLRSKGYPFGWIMDNSDRTPSQVTGIGLTFNWAHHVDISGYHTNHSAVGLMVKLNANALLQGRYDKVLLRKIRIFDNYIFRSNGEGMYIGHTGISGTTTGNSTPYGPPARMDSIEIYNNILDSLDWDGIQLSNALNGCKINNNFVRRYGIANIGSQQAGILSGGNISGVQVYNNMTVNGTGTGIVVFGYNTSNVYHNIVDSVRSGSGIEHGAYLKRNSVYPEIVSPLVPVVTGNIFKNAENYAVYTAPNPETTGGSVTGNYFINNQNNTVANNSGAVVNNNTVVSSFPITINTISKTQTGYSINLTQADSTASFNSVGNMVDWLFSRLNAPAPPNQAPVASAGADKTITLPTNTVTLTGSGTDPDGAVTGYQWTKLSGPAQFTIASATAAQTAVNNLVQGVYSFELRVTDNLGAIDRDTVVVTVNAAPPNQLPTANAGANQTITLPTSTVTLTGTGTDPDGTIASYQWTKITGPAQFTIVSATAAQTAVNNLVQGVYSFELRVTDNLGAIDRDTMTVTVNAAPVNQLPTANAGANQTITLPTSAVTLTGTGTDPDGTIASYQWTKITGPAQFTIVSATAAQTAVNNLVQGVYSFELRVTDNQGAVGRDTMTLTVNAAAPPPNQAPTANAGADQSITLPTNTVNLNGSGTDPDGTIASYVWSKISGPAQFVVVSPTFPQTVVNNLVQGVYQFVLTVTDNQGATDMDTVVVTVNAAAPPPNQGPTANAGADQSITLPTNAVNLTGSGTDPDGTIASYQWTKISGPAQFNIVSPSSAQTAVNSLVQGLYQFVLTVTDNQGATGRDTVAVTVNAAPPPPPPANQPPTANAGIDQTITLPTNSTTLNGSGSDPDGTIASYQWTKIAGPAQFNIVAASSAQTGVNSLVQGVYQFVLTVTDNQGATGRDTVVVTVNAAPPPPANQAPTANAGIDQNITLPTNTVNLNGSGTDPDGTIAYYQWTKIAGPGQFNIVSAAAAQTVVNNLVQGVYQFVLTVTDNQGATGRDTVVVTVNAAPPPVNQAPTANAGTDKIITLPVNSVTISGSGTDPDGSIVLYRWTKISGPSQYTITSPNQAQTQFTNLVEGVYEFELVVTDNQGAVASDVVRVTVEAEPQSLSTAKIFPNPAVSNLNIRIDAVTTTNKTKITIVNMAGVVVYQNEVMRTQQVMLQQVDVSRFAKGSYIITIDLDINNSMTLLFIKK